MRPFCKILATAAVVGCALELQAELANGIKAIVHDSIITVEDVAAMSEPAAKALWRQYRDQPDVFQKKLAQAQTDNLEALLARQLILHDFKTAGYNMPESVIEEMVQERIHGRYGDRMTLTKTLQAEGITNEKFRQQIRDQFIIEVLRQKNISSEIIISPHKVETYYLAHRDDFKVEDEVKLQMIVLKQSPEPAGASAEKRTEEILSKLREGAKFTEMAAVYSEGSQRKADWGW